MEGTKTPAMIECENLVKIYKTREVEVLALQGLELRVDQGELMAIIGNSGSGKSTFLNMIGGLDRPSAGRLIVEAMEKGTPRLCICSDATMLDRLSRLAPTRAIELVAKKMSDLLG